MITAGLAHDLRTLTACLIQDDQHARDLRAARTLAARDAMGQALTQQNIEEPVILGHRDGLDPMGELLLRRRMDVWVAPWQLLEDILTVMPSRRAGPRTRAAILARVTRASTCFAALRPLYVPATPPAQLPLL